MTKYTYQAKLGKIIYIMYTYNKFFVLQTLMIMTFQVSQLDSEQRKNITINYEHLKCSHHSKVHYYVCQTTSEDWVFLAFVSISCSFRPQQARNLFIILGWNKAWMNKIKYELVMLLTMYILTASKSLVTDKLKPN